MKSKILIICLLIILISTTFISAQEKNIEKDFTSIKSLNSLSKEERIKKINQEISKTNLECIAKETDFSDFSIEEKKSMLIQTRPELSNIKKDSLKLNTIKSDYVSSIDWRDNNGNWITPIKSQGECGSCWAFSVIGIIEVMVNINLNNPDYDIDLSEQDLISCSSAGDCNGGNENPTLEYIKSDGIVRESCFPYSAVDESCSNKCENWENELVKILNYNVLTNPNEIKQAINDYSPVTVYMAVYEDFYDYSNGIYQWAYGNYIGLHGISIVGYDDNNEYWICKNSWGTGWGESGFFRIDYSENVLDYPNWNPALMGEFFLDESYVVTSTDIDNDSIDDSLDNCPFNSNNNQSDWDNDGKGDVCDFDIIIKEIMYKPTNNEWIEIYNYGANEVNLSDWTLYENSNKTLTPISNDTLSPNNYAIITEDANQFSEFYPDYSSLLFGISNIYLSNSGELLVLYDSSGNLIDEVQYYGSWGGSDNYSIELINSSLDNNEGSNWRTTFEFMGTPGRKNSEPCTSNLVNTSWSDWTNISCLPDNTMNQTRNLTQYDSNSCSGVDNETFIEYKATELCDFCTPNWTEVLTECQSDDSKIKWFNDSNNCYAITNLSEDLEGRENNMTYNFSCDYDSDGFIGSESNINTTLSLSLINDSNTIKFKENNNTLIEFEFNFSLDKLNLANVLIEKQSNESYGFIVINGLNLSLQNKTKTVYVDNVNNLTTLCLKDAEIDSINEISTLCNGADEYGIKCPGTANNGKYKCGFTDITNSTFNITGLLYSGIQQQTYCGDSSCNGGETCSTCSTDCGACSAPPSGGGGGGGGGGRSRITGAVIAEGNETNVTEVQTKINESFEEEIIQEEIKSKSGITGAVVGFVKTGKGIGIIIAGLIVLIGMGVMIVRKTKS